MKMSFEEFESHRDEYNGYCTNCDDVTRWGMTEPDAENYHCEECDNHTVEGMDNVLVKQLVTLTLEGDDE